MGDSPARMEIADDQGTTLQESGTVGLSNISFPDPALTPIAEFLIQCPIDQSDNNRLYVSLDGGSNIMTLLPGGHWAWTPKGSSVTQINLLGNAAAVKYELVVNIEVD